MRRLIPMVAVVTAAAAAFVQWGAVRFDADFLAMYSAANGVVNGLSPYDDAGQSLLLTTQYNAGEPIPVLPFGYPPWYVLTTFPLGWLDYARAGRAFMLMNLIWLSLGTAWLTAGRSLPARAILASIGGLYLPLIGLVVVGQYTLPVFTGCALGLYGLQKRRPWALAFAALLVSFKWHVGAVPALGFAFLILRDVDLLKRSVGPLAAVFTVASLLGLLLDPRWPLSYTDSVLRLSVADVNQVCDTCSSLAWSVSTRTSLSTGVAGLGLLALSGALMLSRRLYEDPPIFIAALLSATLVSLPYVRNYDFAIFALALIIAAARAHTTATRIVVGLCWAAPLLLPFLAREAADEVLGGSALVLMGLLLILGPASSDPAA
ncbi:MAG: DUF2029 domain-containing protein [Proteobacteria bacterium]|nr:DUF2029 domain-containing protein [Pseudomonadota bacterium]